MNLGKYVDYVTATLAKGTIGAYISVGIFGFLAVCVFFGVYHGAARGFSKSVIRLFTVGASAICAFLAVTGISKLIVNTALSGANKGKSVEALLETYVPGITESMPSIVRPIMSEMNSETAAIFVMMIVAIVLSPIIFIALFYLFRFITYFIYGLLAGLAGAISYGKGIINTLFGAVVGLAQGVLIAAVVIVPISGLCGVASEAKTPLIEESEEPNGYIEMAYNTVINDLADNPLFDLVDKYGGKAMYDQMITLKVDGKKIDMGEECVGAVRVVADIIPVAKPGLDWMHPTETQKDTLKTTVTNIEKSDLITALVADILSGTARSVENGSLNFGLTGAARVLVNDIMAMFATSTEETIVGDLDLAVDVYIIICEREIFDTLKSGDPNAVRDILTNKDAEGNTAVDVLMDRLNEYDRAHTIVTSLTKLSLSMMQESLGFDEDTTELYENVKEDLTGVLNHNKSDFETEEEYKQAVSDDLDKALADNNLNIDEDTKQSMVDYIADNYGDHEGEITDKEINDALLSYYKSYANSLEKGETPPELPDGIEIPEGTEGAEG